jgi:WD repeat-containing protein 61
VALFDVASRSREALLDTTRGRFILCLAFVRSLASLSAGWFGGSPARFPHGDSTQSPSGKQLACGAIDGGVYLFDLISGRLMHKVSDGHALPVRSLAYTSDGALLLTASDDGTVKIFDATSGQLTGTVSGHLSWVLSVASSPLGEQFATGSSDATVKIWDLRTRQCLHTFSDHTNQVWGVAYNRTGNHLASVSDDQTLRIMECP